MTCLLAVIPTEFTCSETQRQKSSRFLWGRATDSSSPPPATHKKTPNTEYWELRWTYFPQNDSLPWNHGKKLPIALITLPRGNKEMLGRLHAGKTSEQWGLGRQTTLVSDLESCTFSSVTRLGVWHAWTPVPPNMTGGPTASVSLGTCWEHRMPAPIPGW